MEFIVEYIKDLADWLILTHLGRIIISAIIMFSGALLVNADKSPIVFYIGIGLFSLEFLILTCAMVWNLIKHLF